MTKISISILGLLLTICLRVQAIDFYSTLNPNSTPGNFYGGLYLSFSSTNSNDYGYNSFLGRNLFTLSAYLSPNYAAFGQDASVSLSFVIGPDGSPANDYLICNFPLFYDSRIGKSVGYGNLVGINTPPLQSYSSLTWDLQSGQPSQNIITYTTGNMLYDLYDGIHPPIDTLSFSYSLPVDFDGTSASAVGSWSLNYTVTTITPTPEPASGWLMALGGFGFWWARDRRRRHSV